MMNRLLDEIMSRFDGELGSHFKVDSRSQLKALIASSLRHVDLVPRDEFDAQAAVLQRTRELLQDLEARFFALEAAARQSNEHKR